tara:strand:- start:276 stop:722 length:447 start_codon:yes stop_codon:yes gene_type:complete
MNNNIIPNKVYRVFGYQDVLGTSEEDAIDKAKPFHRNVRHLCASSLDWHDLIAEEIKRYKKTVFETLCIHIENFELDECEYQRMWSLILIALNKGVFDEQEEATINKIIESKEHRADPWGSLKKVFKWDLKTAVKSDGPYKLQPSKNA